jgi:hypothetical protein
VREDKANFEGRQRLCTCFDERMAPAEVSALCEEGVLRSHAFCELTVYE